MDQPTTSITTRDGRCLQVRRLGRDDAHLLKGFHASLTPRSQRLFFPHAYDDATLAVALARSEKNEDLLLGLIDGRGAIGGYFFLWYFNERVPLLGIGLRDDLQGQGLGRQMMRHLLDAAIARGCEGIELTTLPDNDAAFALYQKVGFVYRGDVENINGSGDVIIERSMFYEIKPGAAPFDRPHSPPFGASASSGQGDTDQTST